MFRIFDDLFFAYVFMSNCHFPRSSKRRGEFGEWVALKLLKKKGFRCIHRNWRSRKDRRMEIDLVCLDYDTLVFVEVRSRSEDSRVNGWHSLDLKKRKSMKKAARSFLSEGGGCYDNYRYDFVEVDLPIKRGSKITSYHHENIAIFNR